MLLTLVTPVSSQSMTWNDVMSAMSEKRFALEDEEKSLKDQLKIIEEQAKVQAEHAELLKARLASLNEKLEKLTHSPPQPIMPGAGPETLPSGKTTDAPQNENELIASSAARMIVLAGKDGAASTAFLAPQDGQIRIFVSAQWLDKNPRPVASHLDGSPVPISEEIGCPVGMDLIALHPKATDLPLFELMENTGKPAVGARVVVILVDPETKQVKGIGGAIRGVGPDTLELNADLTPEMTGAPVLALDSGRVIGIVAPQISGVADEWAVGTRHQENRNFAARIDSIKEWKTSDLGRFANEAAYIDGIHQRTRIAWLAHMLVAIRLESNQCAHAYPPHIIFPQGIPSSRKKGEAVEAYEQRKTREIEEAMQRYKERVKKRDRKIEFIADVKKEARQHAANPHMARVTSWLDDPLSKRAGGDQGGRRSNIYRSILTDLKKQELDLSGHMTWYHQQQYINALENRREGLRVIAENANRVGQ